MKHPPPARCPACLADTYRDKGNKDRFRILQCTGCRSLYAVALPGAPSEDYATYYHAQNLSVPDFILPLASELVRTFDGYRQLNRLLDVGCGAGSLLQAAHKQGWEATGLEVAEAPASHLRGKGFAVYNQHLETLEHESYFDVVLISEVLEHVPDVRSFLAAARRVLRPGGLLYLTTPHGRGLSMRTMGKAWSVVSPPEHLQLLSIAGLRRLLQEAGFKPKTIVTHGLNPFELLQHLRRRLWLRRSAPPIDRVSSGYALNAYLSSSPRKKMLKGLINSGLALTRLGDTIKVYAEKQ